ncbi:MAG: hypothetical protein LBB23_03015 [Rickettsiales bacterium]|jgi:hypothetical protein|nr:hypothetical protein [Rickettsiales bacterium]
MLIDLKNIDSKIQDIEGLPEEIQLRIYKSLHTRFKNFLLLGGESFEKISDNEYRIFNHSFLPSQILMVSAVGQQTLDGNTKYYWKPTYKFGKNDNQQIQQNFRHWTDIGEDYGITISQVAIVPMKYPDGEEYDFTKPNAKCLGFCVPFGKNKALNCGVFSYEQRSIRGFVENAGVNTGNNIRDDMDFRGVLRAVLEQVSHLKQKGS